jgi:hypothetical protein
VDDAVFSPLDCFGELKVMRLYDNEIVDVDEFESPTV